jgi:hypothetical protein
MDRSTGRLPDPSVVSPNGERRRCVRQKLYTPVFASFNGPQTGMVVDLSELLDLHEEGFAVQTSERLEMNRAVTLCLDLPETRSFIHGCGEVVWSDDAGRGGIRFSALSENSRQILKEWLFSNLLIGCVNHAARTEQLAKREGAESTDAVTVDNVSNVVPISGPSEMPSCVEAGLAPSETGPPAFLDVGAGRNEVIENCDDVDAAFHLLTGRALSLTGASGAALAFLTDDIMICRARAGEPSLPLGSPVDSKRGLSGECVRTGLLVSCEDMGNDPRIDPEIGRALGIASLMAVPIVSDFRVVGLLEVFSPHPHGFTKADGVVLERLVEMIPGTYRERPEPGSTQNETICTEALTLPEVASVVSDLPVETGLAPSPETTGSSAVDAGAAPVSSIEFDSIDPLHHALREPELEAPKRPFQPAPAEVVAEQTERQVSEPALEPPPRARSRVLHLLLLGATVAVAAMALGYLLAPKIEERWANSKQASQPSMRQPQLRSLDELRNLADHGDAEAQWQMGVRYDEGDGVPKDDSQAMLWFQLAGEQGQVDAQAHLGAYYWAGRGVPKDLSKAYMWSAIALAGGDENSKSRLEGLASQMTQAQVSAARQQAEIWIRTHSQRAKSEGN